MASNWAKRESGSSIQGQGEARTVPGGSPSAQANPRSAPPCRSCTATQPRGEALHPGDSAVLRSPPPLAPPRPPPRAAAIRASKHCGHTHIRTHIHTHAHAFTRTCTRARSSNISSNMPAATSAMSVDEGTSATSMWPCAGEREGMCTFSGTLACKSTCGLEGGGASVAAEPPPLHSLPSMRAQQPARAVLRAPHTASQSIQPTTWPPLCSYKPTA